MEKLNVTPKTTCKSLCKMIQVVLLALQNSKYPLVQYRACWAYVCLAYGPWPCSMTAAWHLYCRVGKGQCKGASPLQLTKQWSESSITGLHFVPGIGLGSCTVDHSRGRKITFQFLATFCQHAQTPITYLRRVLRGP